MDAYCTSTSKITKEADAFLFKIFKKRVEKNANFKLHSSDLILEFAKSILKSASGIHISKELFSDV